VRRLTVQLAWLAASLCLFAPATARADWLRAESDRFVVYSEDSESALREYVQKLEIFDQAMLYSFGQSIDTLPVRKMQIYLVGNRRGLLRVNPQSGASTVGTYFPTEEDIFAVAITGDDEGMSGEAVLMHEYAHHFMLNNLPGAYPAWFVEGFAEYYMNADIDVRRQRIRLGGSNPNRVAAIFRESWIPLEDLLTKRLGQVEDDDAQATYYPIAWLLTHWFYSEPERLEQLRRYLTLVSEGVESREAMERATGLSLNALKQALKAYTRAPQTVSDLSGQFHVAEVQITRLPRSANDLLLINQRLKVGVPEADRADLGQEVARLAARHGEDPLALLAAGHAGLHFGDRPAGVRALTRLVEIEPDHVEALQYLAQDKLRQADDAEDGGDALRREARALLARAYAAGDNDYRTLVLLTELRQAQSDFPNENDMLTMGLALDRAPQLPAIRFQYAAALAHLDRREEAISVLRPLSNSPHGGGASAYAARAIAALSAGEDFPSSGVQDEEPEGEPPGGAEPTPEEPDVD